MVIGEDIEEQLAPYDENESVEPYKSYWDTETIKRWEQILAEPVKGAESYPPECILTNPGEATMEEIVTVYRARYGDEEDAPAVDEGGIYEWSEYNPKSKWDWYQIGGRWRGYFKLKESAKGHPELVGSPGVFGNDALYDADQVRRGDIDAEFMRDEAGKRAGEKWDKAHAIIDGLPHATSWEEIIARHTDDEGEVNIEAARREYHAQPRVKAMQEKGADLLGFMGPGVEIYQVPRELFVDDARDSAIVPFAYVKDGLWNAPGKMGWFGTSTDTERDRKRFNREFNQMFDSLDDDELVTLVDCHV